jgi:hypothetical protein|tara:strand:+ start:990 stop:1175 length:186 start_codon:yes stop_codon:yes gene_type:complete
MPDITVSFTDAQWARIVAASSHVLRIDEGTVDETKLAANWKAQVTDHVKSYEESLLAAEDF